MTEEHEDLIATPSTPIEEVEDPVDEAEVAREAEINAGADAAWKVFGEKINAEVDAEMAQADALVDKIEEEDMEKKVVKLFQTPHCDSCHEIVGMIKDGKYVLDIEGAEVKIIDVTSEEGFPELAKEDVGGIPSAKFEGKTCRLSINREEGVVLIECLDPVVNEEEDGE